MIKRLIFCVCILVFMFHGFAQRTQKAVDYVKFYRAIDTLRLSDTLTAKKILENIQNSTFYRTNDTVKALQSYSLGSLYSATNRYSEAVKAFNQCAELSKKLHLFSLSCVCLHEKAAVFHNLNDIENAIEIEKEALNMATIAENPKRIYMSKVANASRLALKGNYDESNRICFECLKMVKEEETKGTIFTILASNYSELNLLDKVPYYSLESIKCFKKANRKDLLWNAYANFAAYLNTQGNYNVALKYADSIYVYSKSLQAQSSYNTHKSSSYKGMKDWRNAIKHITESIKVDSLLGNEYKFASDFKDRAEIYKESGNYKLALKDITKAKKLFTGKTDKILENIILREYISNYIAVNYPDIAPDFNKFLTQSSELYNEALRKNVSELDSKYHAAQKEAKINAQQLAINEEKFRNNIAYLTIFIIILMGSITVYWLSVKQKRQKLKQEQELFNLQRDFTTNEIQVLNHQLNPHEIKNFLAVIAPEIQNKAPESYKNLIRLFKLLKSSLNKQSISDSLENQLEQIEYYLELEKKVFAFPIEYQIISKFSTPDIQIPRLILKNMVENAVKHGIKPKQASGYIHVLIEQKDDMLYISIEDNGIGFCTSTPSSTGIGISTYQRLFSLLNKNNTSPAELKVVHRTDGTTIVISIPINYQFS